MEPQHLNLTTKVTTIKRNEGWRLAFLLVTLKKNQGEKKGGGVRTLKRSLKTSPSFHPLRFLETCEWERLERGGGNERICAL